VNAQCGKLVTAIADGHRSKFITLRRPLCHGKISLMSRVWDKSFRGKYPHFGNNRISF